MDGEVPFWSAIAASPTDSLRRLVFADYLDETGRPLVAEAARATAEHHPIPRQWNRFMGWAEVSEYSRWRWVCWMSDEAKAAALTVNRAHSIDRRVWAWMRGEHWARRYKLFTSVQQAFAELWGAWILHHHPGVMIDVLNRMTLFEQCQHMPGVMVGAGA